MKKVLSVSVGEMALKGANRKYFEDNLIGKMKKAIGSIKYNRMYKDQGKIYIEAPEANLEDIINRVKKVFGLVYISPCYRVKKDMDKIREASIQIMKDKREKMDVKTFKIETNRADKNFEPKSPEVSRIIGAEVLNEFEELKVDVHNPEVYIFIDLKGDAYIYTDRIKGYGGMPVGTGGSALLLLSGGIDSSVAGFIMAKRGVTLSAIHFHSYPFTSERAEEKVKTLAQILNPYIGDIKIYSINLLEIQKELNAKCPEEEMTILSRRFMMKIAEEVANRKNIDGIITGESLGQVASQTMDGLRVINASVDKLILRPLIGMDKSDIVEISRDIGTYETSILPFDDCCTLFLPKNPIINPKLEDIEKSETRINTNVLIKNAIKNMKTYKID